MCCLENQIRGTLSGQQFCARKRQLASNNSLHARTQCSGGPQRKPKIQENAGTTGGRRQNAAASKSARSPSLRLPQPRVPPASACRGRRAPTAAPRRAALTLSLYQRFCWIFGSFLVFQSFQLAIQILMPHAPLSRRWPNSCGGSCAYLSVEHTLNRHWLLGPKMMMIVK